MRISDGSSDVCSSDLLVADRGTEQCDVERQRLMDHVPLAADLVGFRLLRIGIDAIRTTFRIRQLDVRAARRLLRKCVVGVNAGGFHWLVEPAELLVDPVPALTPPGPLADGTDPPSL